MTTTTFPFRSDAELDDLLATLTTRCLGCATRMPSTEWTAHGACKRYYGVGRRVDYDRWCSIIERAHDEPLFSRWADGAEMFGVPSYAREETVTW